LLDSLLQETLERIFTQDKVSEVKNDNRTISSSME